MGGADSQDCALAEGGRQAEARFEAGGGRREMGIFHRDAPIETWSAWSILLLFQAPFFISLQRWPTGFRSWTGRVILSTLHFVT